MGNYGVITGQATAQRLTAGTQQLTLLSIADNEGVSILANQFTVDSIGNYLASIKLFPAAIGQGMTCTMQIWNQTTGALAGSAPLQVPLNSAGNIGLSVNIPFNVANVAHNFRIRIVVPGEVRTPNACDLSLQGGSIMQAIISSTSADAGDSGGSFGSGADGDVTIAASAPIAKDMYYNNLTIAAGQALATAGFRIFVRNILTMAAGSSITGNGGAGVAAGGAGGMAGAAAVGATVGAGFIGAAAAPGPGFGISVAGTNATTTGGGAGGASGAGTAGAGAAGGTATAPNAAQGGPTPANVVQHMPNAVTTALAGTAVATLIRGGAGGASGSGDTAASTGGGGGGGGGVVVVAARSFAGTGTIEANGGAGGDGAAAAVAGGGGGGGGGCVLTVSNGTLPVTITAQALGGAAGAAGAGGGGVGTVGAVGNAIHVQLGT
jgi:hypothetical protein